ncbi:hypothetical protein [Aliikangiella sp. G2MR2-5]|uniref:hypothetical protein n=1 Tax=Aliikangiella sp. G2MR2-5 TaxID=2788943 RepID=UPI0018A95813|nr:hypothetical protein [Aliikangiella sp. G2MR2-5]
MKYLVLVLLAGLFSCSSDAVKDESHKESENTSLNSESSQSQSDKNESDKAKEKDAAASTTANTRVNTVEAATSKKLTDIPPVDLDEKKEIHIVPNREFPQELMTGNKDKKKENDKDKENQQVGETLNSDGKKEEIEDTKADEDSEDDGND